MPRIWSDLSSHEVEQCEGSVFAQEHHRHPTSSKKVHLVHDDEILRPHRGGTRRASDPAAHHPFAFTSFLANAPGVRHVSSFLDRVVTSFTEAGAAPGARVCPISTVSGSSGNKRTDCKEAAYNTEKALQFTKSFTDTTFTAAAGTPQEHVQNIYSQAAENAAAELQMALNELRAAGYPPGAPAA